MAFKYLTPAVGVLCLGAATALAGSPKEMGDDALARVVGGELSVETPLAPTGGIIAAGDGNVTLTENGDVDLSGDAQSMATGLEVFNTAHSNIGSGINLAVEQNGLEALSGATSSASDSTLDLIQENIITLSSAHSASAESLINYTAATTSGIATTDNTTNSASVSTGAIDVDVLGLVEVSAPTGTGFAMAGDATVNIETFSVDVDVFSLNGPSLNAGIEGAGCYVTGGNCNASRENDTTSGPAVAAVSVVEASGQGLHGEVISLGNGEGEDGIGGGIEVSTEDVVSLNDNAQQGVTGLKVVNAASSVVGSGVNLSVNRCCSRSFSGGANNLNQFNSVHVRF